MCPSCSKIPVGSLCIECCVCQPSLLPCLPPLLPCLPPLLPCLPPLLPCLPPLLPCLPPLLPGLPQSCNLHSWHSRGGLTALSLCHRKHSRPSHPASRHGLSGTQAHLGSPLGRPPGPLCAVLEQLTASAAAPAGTSASLPPHETQGSCQEQELLGLSSLKGLCWPSTAPASAGRLACSSRRPVLSPLDT